ncbi:MAG: hypothetical protein IT383_07450 [Deltaproteobacteria bacterium]|nr:hypothetical protein [Deltaproteobacteria bacterium]
MRFFFLSVVAAATAAAGCDLSSLIGDTDERRRDRDEDAECGDDRAEDDEACDGADLEGETCESQGFGAGALSCLSTCDDFDRAACGAPTTCGNNAIDVPERCDGVDVGGATCEALGYGPGTLRCADNCGNYDVSGCAPPDGCEPDCGARVCGLDPLCGTVCGACMDGEVCGSDGQCAPAPVCTDEVTACDASGCVVDVVPDLVTVSGALRYDGQVISDVQLEDYYPEAYVRFVNKDTSSSYLYAQTSGATSYTLKIPRGRYDVSLDLEYGESVTNYLGDPIRVASDLDVTADLTVNVEPTLVTVSGALHYDGQAITDVQLEDYYPEAYVRFVNRDTRSSYLYSQTSGATTYTLKIPRGRYDVSLDLEYGESVDDYLGDPIRVASNLDVQGATTVNVEPTLVTVSGSLHYDGQVISDVQLEASYPEAYVRFSNKETASQYLYAQTAGATSYSLKIPRGAYDVALDLEYGESVDDYLGDPIRVASNLDVQGTTTVNIEPTLITVTGSLHYDGQVISDVQLEAYYPEAYVRFINKETLSTYLFSQTSGATTYSLKIPRGRYDVALDLEYGESVDDYLGDPIRVASNLDVQGDTTVNVEPTLVTVSGELRYDGQTISDVQAEAYYPEAYVRFVNRDTMSTYLYSHTSGATSYLLKVPRGRYDVSLDLEYGESVDDYLGDPIRVATNLGIDAATTVDVNPRLLLVTGALGYDGQTISDVQLELYYPEAYVRFVNRETFSSYLFSQTSGATSYSLKIPAGIYDVSLDLEYGESVTDYLGDPIRVEQCVVIE